MSFPTIIVEVKFDADPLSTSGTWTDISDYVRSFDTSRGKQRELERWGTGTARLILDNRDRRFDPNYTAGPYYGNLTPGKRIRIRATWDSTTYDVFTGHVDAWPQAYVNPRDATVELNCSDTFKFPGMAVLPDSAYEMVLSNLADQPTTRYKFGEESGSPILTDSAGNYDGRYYGSPDLNQEALVAGSSDGAALFQLFFWQRAITKFPVLTGYPFTIGFFFKFQKPIRNIFRTIFWAGDSQPILPTQGIICGLWGNAATADADAGKLRFTLYTNSGSVKREIQSTNKFDDGEAHYAVIVCTSASSFTMYVDGANETNVTSAGSPAFPYIDSGFSMGNAPTVQRSEFGMHGWLDDFCYWQGAALGSSDIVALSEAALGWQGEGTGERVGRILDWIGVPAGLQDLDTGSTFVGAPKFNGDNALDFCQSVTESEHGGFYAKKNGAIRFRSRHALSNDTEHTTVQATFGESGAEIRYSDIVLDDGENEMANVVRVQRDGGIVQEVKDPTRIAQQGMRVLELGGLMYQTDDESRDAAQFFFDRRKDQKLYIRSLTMQPRHTADAAFPVALGLEFEDRVRVKRRPQSVGSAIDTEVWVVGIDHAVIASAKTWVTTLRFIPPFSQAPFWVLGDATYSVLGTTTIPCF